MPNTERQYPAAEADSSTRSLGAELLACAMQLSPELRQEAVRTLEMMSPEDLVTARDAIVSLVTVIGRAHDATQIGITPDAAVIRLHTIAAASEAPEPLPESKRPTLRPIDMLLGRFGDEYELALVGFDAEQKSRLAQVLARMFGSTHKNANAALAAPRIRTILDQGAAYAQMGRDEGVDHSTIRNMIHNVHANVVEHLTDEEWQNIIELIDARSYEEAEKLVDTINIAGRIVRTRNAGRSAPSRQKAARSGAPDQWQRVNGPSITDKDREEREMLIRRAESQKDA